MKATNFVKSGNFIKKEDLQHIGERHFTIHEVDVAEFGDPRKGPVEKRLQLVLDDGARFTLNTTNTRVLIKRFGDDTADWIGGAIVLAHDEYIQYAGRMVGGIRVRVPVEKPFASRARNDDEDQ